MKAANLADERGDHDFGVALREKSQKERLAIEKAEATDGKQVIQQLLDALRKLQPDLDFSEWKNANGEEIGSEVSDLISSAHLYLGNEFFSSL